MDIDWQALFVPSGSLAEIAIRGTVLYLVLFAAFRFLPRRAIGAMGASDLLVLVLIADAVQNGMAGEYRSITEGVLLAAVIIGWATFIDWLDYRFPQWHLASAEALPIVVDGKLLHANMRREQITEDEVMSQLRLHGQDSPRAVSKAYLEGDGRVSVMLDHRLVQPPPEARRS
ncbi:MAG: YetF domain-containing protein [Usitatibacter sp.]